MIVTWEGRERAPLSFVSDFDRIRVAGKGPLFLRISVRAARLRVLRRQPPTRRQIKNLALRRVGKPFGDGLQRRPTCPLVWRLVDNVSLYQVCSEEHVLEPRTVRDLEKRAPVHARFRTRRDVQIGAGAHGWPRLLRRLT